jgi:PAS domain S-box-containing protein
MFTADHDGIITEANPACSSLTGVPVPRIAGMHVSALLRPSDPAALTASLERQFAISNEWTTEFVEQYADRAACPMRVTISASRGSDGAIQRMVGVFGRATPDQR